MYYPTLSEYVSAIESAEDNFNELTGLRPVLKADGKPFMSSGNFAVVFKMKDGKTGKLFAVKCFTKDVENRQDSYRLISEELENADSPYLTPIRYMDKELFVDSQNTSEDELPVLLMDWVEGVTLDVYLRSHIDDSYALQMLAYRFGRLSMWLLTQTFAHGDLKPDNILLKEEGSLVLVDYDGMYVPVMWGQRSRELGSPDYRHPLRTEADFNENIDDFSIASIALSLKAISLSPSLFSQYGSADHLLFSAKDYSDLGKSEALKALFSLSSEPELSKLLGLFLLAHSQKDLSSVSFRLFGLKKPDKPVPVVVEEVLSTEVTDEDLADSWTDEYGVKYSKDGKRLLKAPENLTSYIVKEGTKVICDDAFYDVSNMGDLGGGALLTNVSLPDGLVSIGSRAFLGCASLRSILLPRTLRVMVDNPFPWYILVKIESLSNKFLVKDSMLISEGRLIYYFGKDKYLFLPEGLTSIGARAFDGCSSLTSVSFPNGLTSIGDRAFSRCFSLSSVSFPNGLTSIGDLSFFDCSSLTSVSFPNGLTSIGDRAFLGCSSLSSVSFPNGLTSIGDQAFKDCSSLESVSISDSLTSIEDNVFCHCSSLKRVSLPAGITSIGKRSFHSCSSLISVSLPSTLTSIGDWSFGDCSSLYNLSLPEGLTYIGVGAFDGCLSLTSISIPSTLSVIGSNPFSNSNIKKIESLSKKFLVQDDMLISEKKLICYFGKETHISIPVGLTSIGDWAFGRFSSLESAPAVVKVYYMGVDIRDYCSSLESVSLPDSLTFIGKWSFLGCSSLKNIYIPKGTLSKFKSLLDKRLYSKLKEI